MTFTFISMLTINPKYHITAVGLGVERSLHCCQRWRNANQRLFVPLPTVSATDNNAYL
jgi:hypothetical protein